MPKGLVGGTFKPMVTFHCPCGGLAHAGTVTGMGGPETYAVMHQEPRCDDFVRLEPEDYIRWARQHGAVVLEPGTATFT